MSKQEPEKPSNKPYEPRRRFLAPMARPGDGLGYIDIPELGMRGEPEALDADDWKRHVDLRSKRDEEQRQKFEAVSREQARRLLSFEERLVSAHEEARRRCVDVSSEVRLVRHMQVRGKNVRHLEARLFVIERKVWKDAA